MLKLTQKPILLLFQQGIEQHCDMVTDGHLPEAEHLAALDIAHEEQTVQT